MLNLFIDTNILLSFYHLTSEDIDELKKLIALVDNKKINIIITDQLKDKFIRNKGSKINDALKKFKDQNFSLTFPSFTKGYPEYSEMKQLSNDLSKKHSDIMKKIADDIDGNNLAADSVVNDLFQKGKQSNVDDKAYLAALKRVRLGNPPGKESSLGDAVNWECLLRDIPASQNLHLVSGDKDYRSQIYTDRLNEFLSKEWTDKKQSDVIFYTKISDFFKSNYPNIKVSTEIDRDLQIDNLENSGSFSGTHLFISKLSKHTEFSTAQTERLINILLTNNQVLWIAGDPDVNDFYSKLITKYKDMLDSDLVAKALEKIKIKQDEEGDIPF